MQWIARASRAHIIIAITGVFAFVATFAYLQSLDKTITVAQLSHDVKAGSAISSHDISYVHVADDETIERNTISSDDLSDHGLVARVDLSRSDLLTHSNTVRRTTQKGLQSLSIGVDEDRANGGDIKKGDVVDIWQTGDDAHIVARSIPVRDINTPDKRLGVSTSKSLTLVLAVTPGQAQSISSVVGSPDIMVVLATGTGTDASTNEDATSATSHFEPLDTDVRTGNGN